MRLRTAFTATALAALGFVMASPALADTTVTFTVPSDFVGGSVNGFTFDNEWRNYGYDSRNAPFMEYYYSTHTVSYDAGVFDLKAISLGGLPWDGYGGYGTNALYMTLKDAGGLSLGTQTLNLPADNAFVSFDVNVAGVHEISFSSVGFWPRLNSITIGSATGNVPEPQTYALALAGIATVGSLARRRCKPAR